MNDSAATHYGNWIGVGIWIIIYGVFLFFIPFYKKSQHKPTTAYLAFIIAYALEMFGIPMSMYFVAWAFGKQLPDGFLWGHTLNAYIGHWGMYLCVLCNIIGGVCIISGWRRIYKDYWKHEAGSGKLVTTGIYKHIRHPQYTGFLLITLGLIFEWATIPLLLMYPVLIVIYYRLAKKEEQEMKAEFGQQYEAYVERTNMFVPNVLKFI